MFLPEKNTTAKKKRQKHPSQIAVATFIAHAIFGSSFKKLLKLFFSFFI